jgi:hypothetical protein
MTEVSSGRLKGRQFSPGKTGGAEFKIIRFSCRLALFEQSVLRYLWQSTQFRWYFDAHPLVSFVRFFNFQLSDDVSSSHGYHSTKLSKSDKVLSLQDG